MPEVSRFYGIIIRIFFRDHQPPHFHAIYGEYEAVVEIETREIVRGRNPIESFSDGAGVGELTTKRAAA